MSEYHENPETRAKIDAYLEANAKRQANLGIESTKQLREDYKREWKRDLKEIAKLDPELAKVLEPQND